MLKFDIVTIFPQIFDSYFNTSIVLRAQKMGKIAIKPWDLRQYSTDNYKSVDDHPYSGGAGMILKLEQIYLAVEDIKKEIAKGKDKKTRIILFSANGKKFNQDMAKKWAKYDRLVMICGRYEGVDNRVAEKIADEEISIGEYVLTGGELPAMVVVDSIARLMPGVIKSDSLENESFNKVKGQRVLEYPQYTRPEVFITKEGKKWRVPKVLLSGDHKKVQEWKEGKSKKLSPDIAK